MSDTGAGEQEAEPTVEEPLEDDGTLGQPAEESGGE